MSTVTQAPTPCLEFTSLGGLKCTLYKGDVKFPGQESVLVLVDGEKHTLLVGNSPNLREMDAIGRADHLQVWLGPPQRWVHIKKLSLSDLGEPHLLIRWDDMEMDLSDESVRLRLLSYFRFKIGWALVINLVPQSAGEVGLDVSADRCSGEHSLRRCLGLLP